MGQENINGLVVNRKNSTDCIKRQVVALSIKSDWWNTIKGLTDTQKDMVEWNKENWQSLGDGKNDRYAPKAVADSLTSDQKAYENRKKSEGKKKGKQHVPRGKTAKKVYRRIEGR
jgi:hypothetical protein